MFFTYCSNLLAFLTNRHGAYTRLWTHCSCNEKSLYAGNIWPVCQCMFSPACLEHMRPNIQTRVSTHAAFPSGNTISTEDTESEECIIFNFFYRLCVGALMLCLALLEEATVMITSALNHLSPGVFK